MTHVWQDVRYALRLLAKSPGFTAIAVIALALGIGANAAVFSVADAFLLKPVLLPNLDRLAVVLEKSPQQTASNSTTSVSPANYRDWKQQAASFKAMSAFTWDDLRLTGAGASQDLRGAKVFADFFDVLRVRPMLGRTFLPEEEQPGHEREAILTYGLWTRRFGSDPSIVGKTIQLEGKAYTVAGVMGKGVDFPKTVEIWVPLALNPELANSRTAHQLHPVARLKPGVALAQAQAEMLTITKRLGEAFPQTNRGWTARVMSLRDYSVGDETRQYTLMLVGAVGFVLLIACVNVANLLFARASRRQKEIAVRFALGAGRGRIIRQLLTESVLLGLGGAALGLIVALWGVDLILKPMPPDVAKFVAGWEHIRLDSRALLFTIGSAILAGIIAGIGPALYSSSVDLNDTLKEAGRGSSGSRSRHRISSALVVLEVALSLILLIGAGLMVKGFRALLNVNQGFDPQSVLTTVVRLADFKYNDATPKVAFFSQALERVQALPGVQTAALVSGLPYSDNYGNSAFSIEGRPLTDARQVQRAINNVASPGYFRLLHIPLRAGREFNDNDTANGQLVAVIGEAFARRYFPGENPIGHRVKVGLDDSKNSWFIIIGVVGDVLYDWSSRTPEPVLYRCYRQAPQLYMTFVLRTRVPPMQLAEPVRQAIAGVDPEEPTMETKTYQQVIRESVVGIAYVAVMMAVFGMIALLLAAVGVYGVMAYAVSERTHEIGIRMALGALQRDVLRMIVGRGLLLTSLGAVIGLPIAFVLARLLTSLIFGVLPGDVFTYAAILAVLCGVALIACFIPARRAMRVDPMVALRYE